MNAEERVAVVRAMDTIVRCINDEDEVDPWLSNGVADKDYKGTDEHIAESYCDDKTLAHLMGLFLSIMIRTKGERASLVVDRIANDCLIVKPLSNKAAGEDKATKLGSAWAKVMGDLACTADKDNKIDLDKAREIISHYIGGVLDEISVEKGEQI